MKLFFVNSNLFVSVVFFNLATVVWSANEKSIQIKSKQIVSNNCFIKDEEEEEEEDSKALPNVPKNDELRPSSGSLPYVFEVGCF